METQTHDKAATTTKGKIFVTAIDLFSTSGFNGVSIRDITRDVGIKESSFYKHYKSKDELLDTIFEYFNSEFAKAGNPDTVKNDEIIKFIDPAIFLKQSFKSFRENTDNPLMSKIYRIAVMEQFRDNRARDILLNLYEKPLTMFEHYYRLMLPQDKGQSFCPRILATSYQFALYALVAEFSLLKHYHLDTALAEQRFDELHEFFGELLKKGLV